MAHDTLQNMPETTRAYIEGYAPEIRGALLRLRALVIETIHRDSLIGPVTETLKWGQPSFVPVRKCSGTTLRLATKNEQSQTVGLFYHCQTKLGEQLRLMLPPETEYDGSRGVLFHHSASFSAEQVSIIVSKVLTYKS